MTIKELYEAIRKVITKMYPMNAADLKDKITHLDSRDDIFTEEEITEIKLAAKMFLIYKNKGNDELFYTINILNRLVKYGGLKIDDKGVYHDTQRKLDTSFFQNHEEE